MIKHRFQLKRLVLVAAALLGLMAAPLASGQGIEASDVQVQRAQAHFQEGFYGHAPKGRAAEAAGAYQRAAQAFQAALDLAPGNLEAERGLARVNFVQRDFAGAARHYQRVTELAPFDLDAYVHQALALIELRRLDDAVWALEAAQARTTDVRALAALDGYIARIRGRQGEGVK